MPIVCAGGYGGKEVNVPFLKQLYVLFQKILLGFVDPHSVT